MRVVCGKWYVVSGMWYVVCGEWYLLTVVGQQTLVTKNCLAYSLELIAYSL